MLSVFWSCPVANSENTSCSFLYSFFFWDSTAVRNSLLFPVYSPWNWICNVLCDGYINQHRVATFRLLDRVCARPRSIHSVHRNKRDCDIYNSVCTVLAVNLRFCASTSSLFLSILCINSDLWSLSDGADDSESSSPECAFTSTGSWLTLDTGLGGSFSVGTAVEGGISTISGEAAGAGILSSCGSGVGIGGGTFDPQQPIVDWIWKICLVRRDFNYLQQTR